MRTKLEKRMDKNNTITETKKKVKSIVIEKYIFRYYKYITSKAGAIIIEYGKLDNNDDLSDFSSMLYRNISPLSERERLFLSKFYNEIGDYLLNNYSLEGYIKYNSENNFDKYLENFTGMSKYSKKKYEKSILLEKII